MAPCFSPSSKVHYISLPFSESKVSEIMVGTIVPIFATRFEVKKQFGEREK
jgi:hypothetical protein